MPRHRDTKPESKGKRPVSKMRIFVVGAGAYKVYVRCETGEHAVAFWQRHYQRSKHTLPTVMELNVGKARGVLSTRLVKTRAHLIYEAAKALGAESEISYEQEAD